MKGDVVAYISKPINLATFIALFSSDNSKFFVVDIDDAENIIIRES